MAVSLAGSSQKVSAGATTETLTADALTIQSGDVIVVKAGSWTRSRPPSNGDPTATGLTFTQRAAETGGSGNGNMYLWTAVAASNLGSTVITLPGPTLGDFHAMSVEVYRSGALAASPVVVTGFVTTGTAPDIAFTTTAANSVITWGMYDVNITDPATRVYRNGGADVAAPVYDPASGTFYWAYQTAAAAGLTSYGLTAPTTIRYNAAGVEILAVDTNPSLPAPRPPGRISPAGRWTPFLGDTANAAGTTYPVSVGGALAPSGAPVRQVGKVATGTLTPVGDLVRQVGKSTAGTLTPTGTPVKQIQKPLAGSAAPDGALSSIRLRVLAVAGSLTPTGALLRQPGKALAGALTPTGVVNKQISHLLDGSITPTGSLTNIRTRLLAVAGSLAPSGALVRRTGKVLDATVPSSGGPVRQVSKQLTGTAASSGIVSTTRTRFLALAGALTPTGALRRIVGKALDGTATPSGALTKLVGRLLAGAVAPDGGLIKLLGRSFTGSLPGNGEVTPENLGVVIPVVAYPIRSSTIVDLAVRDRAGTVTDSADRDRAGSITDQVVHYHAGTPT